MNSVTTSLGDELNTSEVALEACKSMNAGILAWRTSK